MTLYERLKEALKDYKKPTPEEVAAHRRSWVYGNLNASTNHKTTWEEVDAAIARIDAEKAAAKESKEILVGKTFAELGEDGQA